MTLDHICQSGSSRVSTVANTGENSCVRRRAQHKDHVWSYDFVADRLEDGRQIRLLVVEFTRECLAIEVARSFTAQQVIEILRHLFAVRDAPQFIPKSDEKSIHSRDPHPPGVDLYCELDIRSVCAAHNNTISPRVDYDDWRPLVDRFAFGDNIEKLVI